MTIGIAAIVRGGVVAIADGRTTEVVTGAIVDDESIKIHPVGKDLAVTIFGVTAATSAAVTALTASPPTGSAEDCIREAKAALFTGWSSFLAKFPQAPLDHPSVRAALLLTGRDAKGPYLAATLVDQEGVLEVGPTWKEGANIVLGAEDCGSHAHFLREMNIALEQLPVDATACERIHAVVEAGAVTAHAMQTVDATVGGRIHFRAFIGVEAIAEGDLSPQQSQPPRDSGR